MLDLLAGTRVLSLSPQIPGAAVARVLADLGADVINVEVPGRGDTFRGMAPTIDGLGIWEIALNRGKRSIAVDFREAPGREVLDRLLATADALVEVSRPGALQRYDLDAATVRGRWPTLVYCSVSGYGQTGPYRDLPAHGMNIDAAAGAMTVERAPGTRPEVTRAAAIGIDHVASSAALAVVAALLRRERTGHGAELDASSWDAAVVANRHFGTTLNFGAPVQLTPFNDKSIMQGPKYNVYGTRDDRVLLLAPIEPKFWRNFCMEVDRADWLDRGDASARFDFGQDDPELRDDIEAMIRTRDLDTWITDLLAAEVPAAPVLDVTELADNPHLADRAMVVPSADPRYPSVRYVRPAVVDVIRPLTVTAPPRLGEHTLEVLGELGYRTEELEKLLASGSIATGAESGPPG